MYPIFITDDPEAETVIQSLPGQKRYLFVHSNSNIEVLSTEIPSFVAA